MGEPGLGKTEALEAERSEIQTDISRRGDLIDWVRLQEFETDDRLERRVFASTIFQEWLRCDAQLHLFLDSLDESRLLIRNVASFLAGEFSRDALPIDRLWLRVACRTAEWPEVLENRIRNRSAQEDIAIYELASLRRKNVELAAQRSALRAAKFLEAIDQAEAVPLAIKPITLKLLLKLFERNGHLPRSKWELYEQGCD